MSQTATTKQPPPAERALYERDLHAWAHEQARLLRAGRLDLIDAENLAEEIVDVGNREYDKLESALRVLLTHMLKWDHQKERRTRSWENTIHVQRRHALRQLRKNPSLKPHLDEAIAEAYDDARRLASSETDRDVERFPESCPYGWEEMMGRVFDRSVSD